MKLTAETRRHREEDNYFFCFSASPRLYGEFFCIIFASFRPVLLNG